MGRRRIRGEEKEEEKKIKGMEKYGLYETY